MTKDKKEKIFDIVRRATTRAKYQSMYGLLYEYVEEIVAVIENRDVHRGRKKKNEITPLQG